MKKIIIGFLIAFTLAIGFYMNKTIEFKYDVNLIDYISLSSDYSDDTIFMLICHKPAKMGADS